MDKHKAHAFKTNGSFRKEADIQAASTGLAVSGCTATF